MILPFQSFSFTLNSPRASQLAENAIPQNTEYVDINSDFIDGFIDEINIHHAFITYSETFEETTEQRLKAFEMNPHLGINYLKSDVLLLGETDNSYWQIIYTKSPHYCYIGRFEKSRVVNVEQLVEQHIDNCNKFYISYKKIEIDSSISKPIYNWRDY